MIKVLTAIFIVVVLSVAGWSILGMSSKKAEPCTSFRAGTFREKRTSEISSKVCITSGEVNYDVVRNISSFQVAFVDEKNKEHTYSAIAGGKNKDGEDVKVAFCEILDDVMNCSFINSFELVTKLNKKTAMIDVVFKGDDRDWGDGEMSLEDFNFYEKLKDAVVSGGKFPSPREGFNLHVAQITIKANE